MKFNNTQTCAVQEIYQLRSHATAEDAMESFYNQEVKDPMPFKGWRTQGKHLYSFYMFSSGVPNEGETGGQEWVEPSGFMKLNNYGINFAKLIRENGLGTLTETPAVRNDAFHKDHANKVWLWTPNKDAIIKWYEARHPKKDVPELSKEVA